MFPSYLVPSYFVPDKKLFVGRKKVTPGAIQEQGKRASDKNWFTA